MDAVPFQPKMRTCSELVVATIVTIIAFTMSNVIMVVLILSIPIQHTSVSMTGMERRQRHGCRSVPVENADVFRVSCCDHCHHYSVHHVGKRESSCHWVHACYSWGVFSSTVCRYCNSKKLVDHLLILQKHICYILYLQLQSTQCRGGACHALSAEPHRITGKIISLYMTYRKNEKRVNRCVRISS